MCIRDRHKDIYPWQVWLDGTYMAQRFYMEYETRYNKMQGLSLIHISPCP